MSGGDAVSSDKLVEREDGEQGSRAVVVIRCSGVE